MFGYYFIVFLCLFPYKLIEGVKIIDLGTYHRHEYWIWWDLKKVFGSNWSICAQNDQRFKQV